MAKAKRSKAQKAATKRMIAARRKGMHGGVARAAKKNAKRAKTKTPRKRARSSKMPDVGAAYKKATKKRGGYVKKGKRGKKAAAKKAAATRAKNKAKRSAAGKKAARTRKRNAGKTATPRKRKSSGGKRKGAHKRKSGSKPRKRARSRKVKSSIVKMPAHTTKVVVVPVPGPRRAKRRSSRKGKGKSKSAKRKAAAKKGAATRKRNKRKGASEAMELHGGAMYGSENPLGAAEIIFGAFTGLIGWATSEVVDRMIATHALTANGDGTFTDPQGAAGSDYANLYNGTAVLAPMSLMRWGAGVAITVAPFGVAAMVRSPVGKTSLQMFGFGAGIRLLGKALTDVVAQLTASTQFGQQVFINEQRAIAAMPGSTLTATLPSSGLGRPALGVGGAGCTCSSCQQGVGRCCGGATSSTTEPPPVAVVMPAQNPAPPPPPPPPMMMPPVTPVYAPVVATGGNDGSGNGGGTPAPAPQIQGGQNRHPVVMPTPPPAATQGNFVTGLPGVGAPPARRSKYDWGNNPDTGPQS